MKRVKALELLGPSEARARWYLRHKAWTTRTVFCIRCSNRKLYRLSDRRYRCGACGYTFQEFAGRWIAELQIGAVKWLWALKLFQLDVGASLLAEEIGISHPTALKVIRIIRLAILQNYLSAQARKAEPYWRDLLERRLKRQGVSAERHQPVGFVIERRNGWLHIAPLETLSEAELSGSKNIVRSANLIFVQGRDRHELLMIWGDLRGISRLRPRADVAAAQTGADQVDRDPAAPGEFAIFARRRLGSRKISRRDFPLHLIETSFRFENRKEDLFDLLASAVCQIVPNV
jgi:transposase